MSLNFCDENPDQSTSNAHCFHPVSRSAKPWKRGEPKTRKMVVVTLQCCWCGDKATEDKPENLIHGSKVRVIR